MKHLFLLFISIICISCDPIEGTEDCQLCLLIEESNRIQLELKCAGKANSYPAFTEQLSVQNLGNTCTDSERSSLKNEHERQISSLGPLCGNDFAIRRFRLECQ